jgi:putative PIN family toxin of toxin-antitoxin system
MLKAVIDTNVLISAVLSKSGTPAEMLDRWRKRLFIVATSETAIQEAQRVLDDLSSRGRYNLPSSEVSEFIQLLRKEALFVSGQIAVSGIIPQDKTDEIFLAIALEVNADAIVSGDKHLLKLGKFNNIPIVTPHQFLDLLEQEIHE